MSSGTEFQTIICELFWEPQLGFSKFKRGDKLVEFKSLWPQKYKDIKSQLEIGRGLNVAFWDLCVLIMAGGPVSVLNALHEMKYLQIGFQFANGPSMLHLARVLQNEEAVKLIKQYKVSSKIKDKSGQTAEEVTKPSSYRLKKPFLADKDRIFELASNPNDVYDLMKCLQNFEFEINMEMKNVDYLVHIAAKAGMCQLPCLMLLVNKQNADINLCNAEGMTPLMIFAKKGDYMMCDTLICVLGADPDTKNTLNKRTALHYAAEGGHYKCVECSVNQGANVNAEDQDLKQDSKGAYIGDLIKHERKNRTTELFAKISTDAVNQVDLRSTDLFEVNEDGNTLLMVAAQNDCPDNLAKLLSKSVEPINVRHSKTGLTALAFAAKAGNKYCCDILLRAEADPSIPDMAGYLPLHHAVFNNHKHVIKVFKDHFPLTYVGCFKAISFSKTERSCKLLKRMIKKRTRKLLQPQLTLLAKEGDANKMNCLLEEGDDVNFKSAEDGQYPLFHATKNNHMDVVRILVDWGADLRKRDEKKNTVLHIATQTGNTELVKYLYEKSNESPFKLKLDINAVNNDKKTVLQIAAEKGSIDLVRLLINYGATADPEDFTSPELEESRDFMDLIQSHLKEHAQAVFKLLSDKSKKAVSMLSKVWESRFDHKLRDNDGMTPLMIACKCGSREMVEFLLQTAVQFTEDEVDPNDPAIEDASLNDKIVSHVRAVNLSDGNTALLQTIERGDNKELAMMLIEADPCVINIQNNDGLSPVHLACKHGRKDTLAMLLTVNELDLDLVANLPPEKMTTNKTLVEMVEMARRAQRDRKDQSTPESSHAALMKVSNSTLRRLRRMFSSQETVHSGTLSFSRMEQVYNEKKIGNVLISDRIIYKRQ